MKEVKIPKEPFMQKLSVKLDGIVNAFSPKMGLRRKGYRYLSTQFSYLGARTGRYRSWGPVGGSADEDLLHDLPTLRERCRFLNQNDAHATGITSTMISNVVGAGIKPNSRVDRNALGISEFEADKFSEMAERAWSNWVPFADASNRMDFYEIQELVLRNILENGEAIIFLEISGTVSNYFI